MAQLLRDNEHLLEIIRPRDHSGGLQACASVSHVIPYQCCGKESIALAGLDHRL